MKQTLKHIFFFGLFGLAASSIGLNFFLFERAQAYYLALNASHLDPLGLSVYPTTQQPEIVDETETLVVFFGDSRAAQWAAPDDASGFTFINRGIGNQTSTQIQQRFDAHIRPLNPDIIILQVCINDLKTIPLFENKKANIVETCKHNIDAIATEASKIGSTVIISTIFPTGKIHPARRIFWSPEIEAAILDVNNYIMALSNENVIVFDSYQMLVDENDRVHPDYNHDTLHINVQGYKHLNKHLLQQLKLSR